MVTKPKVSLIQCASYEQCQPALDALLEPLGGMEHFISPGQTVLIKPNMLTDRTPDKGVTTHPELIRAVIRSVRRCGGKPVVGDSPASAVKLASVHDKTGIAAVCGEENVPLLNFESAGSVTIHADEWSLHIAKPVLEADVVINLAKVKTHVLTILTAAVKNLYGVLPGYQKAHLHKACPAVHRFGKLLNALHASVTPAVSIADGIIGMEGDGPSGGDPVQLGFLAASTDAYALDRTLCRILGIPQSAVPYLSPENGAPPAIKPEVVGATVEQLVPAAFRIPGTLTARLIPSWLIRMLDRFLWVRPSVSDRCVFCARCVEACPVAALTIKVGEKPELIAPHCIGCCCCHEVCPEKAIEMMLSPLLGVLRRGRSIS